VGGGVYPSDHFSRIEKDDDLAKTIQVNIVGYAKPLTFA